ncbi:MAG: hypothetical protein KIS72_02795, partial [Luteimonas sp.]|nr:hypothetical protein [Luteimonas sp.]
AGGWRNRGARQRPCARRAGDTLPDDERLGNVQARAAGGTAAGTATSARSQRRMQKHHGLG